MKHNIVCLIFYVIIMYLSYWSDILDVIFINLFFINIVTTIIFAILQDEFNIFEFPISILIEIIECSLCYIFRAAKLPIMFLSKEFYKYVNILFQNETNKND